MYPAMEKHLGEEGLQLTNTDREQHQAVGLPHAFPYFDTLLTMESFHIIGQRRPL